MAAPTPDAEAAAFIDFANELTHLPPDDLPEVIGRFSGALGATSAAVYLVDLAQEALHPLGPPGASLTIDGTLGGRAYRTQEIVTRVDDDRVELWVPLMDSTERLGVLAVELAGLEHSSDPHLLERWSAVGSLTGESIMAKSSYGDQVSRTRGLHQASLAAEMRWAQLPPLTFSSAQVSVSGILEPAYDIAGDTFDYSIDGDEISAAILDAMGHGLQASRMANLAVASYRHARRRRHPIDQTLLEIDRVIADQFGEQRFVTGQIAVLRVSDGLLRLVNAGHPPPLHLRNGRFIGELECRPRPPLGLGAVETTMAEVGLEPGDVVLLYTDGVTEARSPSGEEFGSERLADMVSRQVMSGVPSAEVLRQVVKAVYEFSGPRLRDDASLVFLRWDGT
jgi:hypothetical protein